VAFPRRAAIIGSTLAAVSLLVLGVASRWDELFEKRVVEVVRGALIRGAWQRPAVLERLIRREGIRTIVTLAAINEDDPKYVAQATVVKRAGVDWVRIPMRGSTATLEQMREAADLLSDPARQPVFFHCVAGHHRTGLAHAAYRIAHDRWTAEQAWAELKSLPWTRPGEPPDEADRRLIGLFAARVQMDQQRGTAAPLAEVRQR
jgi:protein tyrosine phosphatase (PTP) superfamily phosphohydrolase (DUF442 family)